MAGCLSHSWMQLARKTHSNSNLNSWSGDRILKVSALQGETHYSTCWLYVLQFLGQMFFFEKAHALFWARIAELRELSKYQYRSRAAIFVQMLAIQSSYCTTPALCLAPRHHCQYVSDFYHICIQQMQTWHILEKNDQRTWWSRHMMPKVSRALVNSTLMVPLPAFALEAWKSTSPNTCTAVSLPTI